MYVLCVYVRQGAGTVLASSSDNMAGSRTPLRPPASTLSTHGRIVCNHYACTCIITYVCNVYINIYAGSRAVDFAIFDLVAQECEAKHAVHIDLCTPLGQRLLTQCQATKKILSTVGQSNLFLEGAKGDTDITFPVSRAAVEEALKDYTTRVSTLVTSVLEAAEGVTLLGCEVIGGGSCVPMVQAAIASALAAAGHTSLAIGHTMDLTASVAYGAALAAWAVSGSEGGIVVTEKEAWDAGLEEVPALTDEALEAAVQWETQVKENEAAIIAVEKVRHDSEKLICIYTCCILCYIRKYILSIKLYSTYRCI